LEVLRKENATAGFFGGAQNQRRPKRESMQPVKINSSDNIGNVGSSDVKFG
jgi:hypothetical protein